MLATLTIQQMALNIKTKFLYSLDMICSCESIISTTLNTAMIIDSPIIVFSFLDLICV